MVGPDGEEPFIAALLGVEEVAGSGRAGEDGEIEDNGEGGEGQGWEAERGRHCCRSFLSLREDPRVLENRIQGPVDKAPRERSR